MLLKHIITQMLCQRSINYYLLQVKKQQKQTSLLSEMVTLSVYKYLHTYVKYVNLSIQNTYFCPHFIRYLKS